MLLSARHTSKYGRRRWVGSTRHFTNCRQNCTCFNRACRSLAFLCLAANKESVSLNADLDLGELNDCVSVVQLHEHATTSLCGYLMGPSLSIRWSRSPAIVMASRIPWNISLSIYQPASSCKTLVAIKSIPSSSRFCAFGTTPFPDHDHAGLDAGSRTRPVR